MNMGHIIMGMGGAILLGLAATQDNPFAADPLKETSVTSTAGNLTFSDTKHYFEYELSSQREVLTGIATMTGKQKGIKEGGVLLTLHYFDDKAATKFAKKYAGTKQCPAPFFNRHAKQKLLLASDPAIIRQITSWKNEAYKNVSGWQDFKLIGRCLTKTVKAEVKGEPVYLPRNFHSKCLTFHVEKISYSPRSVSS